MTVKHLYPNSTPALNFNFKSSRVADPRLSCVRNSIGTYVDPVSGLIKTAAANKARVGKDGLLIEESRTNNITNSQVFSTGYITNGITPTDNAVVAPDGTTTAASIFELGGGTASHGFFRTSTSSSGFAQSIFVKPNGRDNICLRFAVPGVGNWYSITFNLTGNGSVTQEEYGSAETWTYKSKDIQHYGNGWYRISAAAETSTATTVELVVDGCTSSTPTLFSDDGAERYVGDTSKGYYVWGAQVEEGKTFPTSYIPTNGSTYQRLADDISVLNGGTFNELKHTIVNRPFGVAQAVITSGNETRVDLLPGRPIERLAVHSDRLTGNEVTAMSCDDEFWKVRVLGSSFAFDRMTTDGVVKVDWGDGTAIETLTTASHTFTNGSGYHDIGLKLESGTYFWPEFRYDTEIIAVGPTPLSMKLNGTNLFRDCDVHTFDAGIKFTSINRAFNDSRTLRVLPFIDTSEASVVNMSAFFYQNRELQRVPLFDTSASTTWINAFRRCNALKELPHFDTSNVTEFSFAFNECRGLTTIPLLDTSSAWDFGNMFKDCNYLVNIPLLDLSSATQIRVMFRGCGSLQAIPAFNTSNVIRFDQAFQACHSITSFPAIDLSAGKKFDTAWRDCINLATFPANMFDNFSGPWNKCFNNTWLGCTSLDTTGVENILVSIAASGAAAPSGTGTNDRKIHIDYDTSTGSLTTNTTNAIATLKATTPAWEIYINGVLQ